MNDSLIGRTFRSVRTNVLYKIIEHITESDEYLCEFRIQGSLRNQRSCIKASLLIDETKFTEVVL